MSRDRCNDWMPHEIECINVLKVSACHNLSLPVNFRDLRTFPAVRVKLQQNFTFNAIGSTIHQTGTNLRQCCLRFSVFIGSLITHGEVPTSFCFGLVESEVDDAFSSVASGAQIPQLILSW